MVYSEWRTFELGDAHYREKYGPSDRTDAQLNIWSTVRVTSNYQTSRMFVSGLPFSVTSHRGPSLSPPPSGTGYVFERPQERARPLTLERGGARGRRVPLGRLPRGTRRRPAHAGGQLPNRTSRSRGSGPSPQRD